MKKFRFYRSMTPLLLGLPLLCISMIAGAEDVVSSGTFTGASNHVTSGGVSVVKTNDGLEVVLSDDFKFDGAPDPKVGFGKNGKYDIKSQLAHLEKNTGAQRYSVPISLDISGYNEIYIWCEAYSVPLGVAVIK
jgi:hypothetical protein